jgi:hypothetical protein
MLKKIQIAFSSCRRESAKSWGYALRWSTRRFYYRFIKRYFSGNIFSDPTDQDREITVVIPAAEKDAPVLAHCLKSVKMMVRHRLSSILVVAPESELLKQISLEAGVTFIFEDEILPIPASELNCRGWLLQQFIKLNTAFHVSTKDYLVLDADTVFLKPQTFFCSGKTVLRYADQYELLYNRSLQMTLGHARRFPVSFVTHHMVLNVGRVKKLIGHIERQNKQPWYEYILGNIDEQHNHKISFSEYELYGNYIVTQPAWRRNFRVEYWHGQEACAEDVTRLKQILRGMDGKINTISFHQHTQ